MVEHLTLDEALSHARDQLAQAMARVAPQKSVMIEPMPMPLPYKDPSPRMIDLIESVKRESFRIPPGAGIPINSYERYSFTHHDHRAMHGELRPGTADNDPHHPVTRQAIRDNHYKQETKAMTRYIHCVRCGRATIIPMMRVSDICDRCVR